MVDGFLHRVLDAGTLELCNHHGDAVDEQHRIRDDMPTPAGEFDLKLVDNEKIIVGRVIEVNEANRLGATILPVGQSVGNRTLEEEFCR